MNNCQSPHNQSNNASGREGSPILGEAVSSRASSPFSFFGFERESQTGSPPPSPSSQSGSLSPYPLRDEQSSSSQQGQVGGSALLNQESHQLCEQLIQSIKNSYYSSMAALRTNAAKVNQILASDPRQFMGWVLAYRVLKEAPTSFAILGQRLKPIDCLYRAHYHCNNPSKKALIQLRLESELQEHDAMRIKRESKKRKAAIQQPLSEPRPGKKS